MNNSKLTPKVQKNLILAVAILWSLCAVVLGVVILLGLFHHAAIMQRVLHGFCAVLAVVLAVSNFVRWRKMPTETATDEDVLDSKDE